jgi:hypothetical protein
MSDRPRHAKILRFELGGCGVTSGSATWRRCSSCKTDIGFRQPYWVCNVSTCNRKRTGLVFCSVSCWDAHLPLVRHRESWALERTSPSAAEWERERAAQSTSGRSAATRSSAPTRFEAPREPRRIVSSPAKPALAPEPPAEILVVASKLKSYVRARSGMNTSDRVMDLLSDRLRRLCDAAIQNARRAERKTVLDRDFE